ncbi:MAG: hypothetical protein LRY73_07375 [Bacillus sp. (in: Bacteria)]|nr:hypothetical protein [Bacillus sp. (in: firmicutes)]
MGQFRIFTAATFAVLHIVALITLVVMFTVVGVALGFVYMITSILAIVFAFLVTVGIIVLQVKEVRMGEEGSFPFLLPVTTTVLVYDVGVLGLILLGLLFSSGVYVSLHFLLAVAFVATLAVVGGFAQFVKKRDDEVKERVGRIKELQREVQYIKMLIRSFEREPGRKELLANLDSLEEAIRFSNPVSREEMSEVDNSIEVMLGDLKVIVEKLVAEGEMSSESEEEMAKLSKTVDQIRYTIDYR